MLLWFTLGSPLLELEGNVLLTMEGGINDGRPRNGTKVCQGNTGTLSSSKIKNNKPQ